MGKWNLAWMCAAMLSLSCSAAAQDVSQRFVGVPLPVLLSAFAGAGLILSFLPHRDGSLLRVTGTIIFCTLGAATAAPNILQWLIRKDAAFTGGASAVAFITAALLQIVVPLLIENRTSIFYWLASKVPGGKQ